MLLAMYVQNDIGEGRAALTACSLLMDYSNFMSPALAFSPISSLCSK